MCLRKTIHALSLDRVQIPLGPSVEYLYDMPPKDLFEHRLKLYEKLLATIPKIERKGAAMPYTSVNGNMFTFLDKEGNLNLRLDEKNREDFLKKYKDAQSIQHGIVMKEYVAVPSKLLTSTKTLQRLLGLSFAYASALNPKKSKK